MVNYPSYEAAVVNFVKLVIVVTLLYFFITALIRKTNHPDMLREKAERHSGAEADQKAVMVEALYL